MLDSKKFDDIANTLCSVLPNSLQSIEKDIQQKFKAILQSAFTHLDLVTREEFDVQCKVLMRTREKVERLEQHIHELNKK